MISVCMATHNGERFLEQQLATILEQLEAGDELVVSDDSSTDATLDIVRRHADPRIRLFSGNRFFSPVFNFEHALQQAKGDILVLADQDDVWLPGKLELVRQRFAGRPAGPYLLVMDGRVVAEDETVLDDSLFRWLNARPGLLRNLFFNRFPGCCLAFSRELLEQALPFPRQLPMHDWWLGLLCEMTGTTEFVPVPTILYRKHGGSLTEFRIRFMPLRQVRWRVVMVFCLVRRLLGG
jgi:glycosyltransferase involved in cell wall biosynthesis